MRSWRPTSAMRTIGSIGDFLTSAMPSYALTWPTETCGSTKVASDAAITMSASATKCSPPPAHVPFEHAYPDPPDRLRELKPRLVPVSLQRVLSSLSLP